MSSGMWFSNPLSLAPPGVPEQPGEDFFDQKTLEEARRGLEDPESLCILLTGRKYALYERVKAICQSVGLYFPLYCLREDIEDPKTGRAMFETTMDYKIAVVRAIFAHRALRHIRFVKVFDDRESQLKKFYDELRHLWKIHKIDAFETKLVEQDAHKVKLLDPEDERRLVKSVIEGFNARLSSGEPAPTKIHSGFRPPRNMIYLEPLFQYTGIMLDEESIATLKTHPLLARSWYSKVTADHVTLTLASEAYYMEVNGGEGTDLDMEAYSFGEIAGTVLAVAVRKVTEPKRIKCWNKVSHVTIGIGEGGKARQSNDIQTWTPLPEPIRLRGQIGEKFVMTVVERKGGR